MLDESLKVAEGIGNEGARARALSIVAEAMDSIPTESMPETVIKFQMIFQFARMELGDTLLNIGIFANALAKLGLLNETWKRYRAISEFISGRDDHQGIQ